MNEDEIDFVVEFFQIGPYVRYLRVEYFTNEEQLKIKFGTILTFLRNKNLGQKKIVTHQIKKNVYKLKRSLESVYIFEIL